MTTWALLAPGPSATREQAEAVRHLPLGAVSNAFQLAPFAQFVASSDGAWWRKYPEAKQFGERYAMAPVPGVTRVFSQFGSPCNSGVLALEVVKMKGAKRVILLGFDMHGDHFFGRYTNGLTNTPPDRRRIHLRQFEAWAKANRDIEVINCTQGSALTCFPMARLDDFCRDVQMGDSWLSGQVHVGACEHPSPDGGETLRQAAPISLHHG